MSQQPKDAPSLEIKRVLEKNTSDVAISDLAKKGFKQVKVLNSKAILGLIDEAVDKVVASRKEEISAEERDRVVKESREKFDSMVQEKLAKERLLGEIQSQRDQMKSELNELRERFRDLSTLESERDRYKKELEEIKARTRNQFSDLQGERDQALTKIDELEKKLSEKSDNSQQQMVEKLTSALLGKLSVNSGGSDLSALQKSIQNLSDRISCMGTGGASASAFIDGETNLERLFKVTGSGEMDSNVSEVKVKESKAGGVKNTLAKLKALQQGGAKDGE